MNDKNISSTEPNNLNRISHGLADLIDLHLNQGWFYNVAEESVVNANDISRIIESFSINSYLHRNRVKEAADNLDRLLSEIRQHILPKIREKLGISHLTGQRQDRSSAHFIKQSMIAYTFPHNLNQIESMLRDLQTMIMREERMEKSRASLIKQVI